MMEVMKGEADSSGPSYDLDGLLVRAPVDRPSKLICIGLNYRSHIKEMKWEIPEKPIIFSKPSSAIIGPMDDIVIPDESSRVDYEGESALVIGKRARRVTDGSKHIFGYTCFNDVTARDLQKTDVDWTRAKGFDTFAPIGPFISTKCPSTVETRLNGKVVDPNVVACGGKRPGQSEDRITQTPRLGEGGHLCGGHEDARHATSSPSACPSPDPEPAGGVKP